MNHLYDLSSFETIESLFEQIKEDYILSAGDVPRILRMLEEYFWLKENAAPARVSEKWADIRRLLDSLNMKVKK